MYSDISESAIFSFGKIGNRVCVVKSAKFATCSVLREPGNEVKKYPDLASVRFRIYSVFRNFHSGGRIQKVADSSAGLVGWSVAMAVAPATLKTVRFRP